MSTLNTGRLLTRSTKTGFVGMRLLLVVIILMPTCITGCVESGAVNIPELTPIQKAAEALLNTIPLIIGEAANWRAIVEEGMKYVETQFIDQAIMFVDQAMEAIGTEAVCTAETIVRGLKKELNRLVATWWPEKYGYLLNVAQEPLVCFCYTNLQANSTVRLGPGMKAEAETLTFRGYDLAGATAVIVYLDGTRDVISKTVWSYPTYFMAVFNLTGIVFKPGAAQIGLVWDHHEYLAPIKTYIEPQKMPTATPTPVPCPTDDQVQIDTINTTTKLIEIIQIIANLELHGTSQEVAGIRKSIMDKWSALKSSEGLAIFFDVEGYKGYYIMCSFDIKTAHGMQGVDNVGYVHVGHCPTNCTTNFPPLPVTFWNDNISSFIFISPSTQKATLRLWDEEYYDGDHSAFCGTVAISNLDPFGINHRVTSFKFYTAP